MSDHHKDWADLVADFFHELTEKNAEIEFNNLEVHIPVSTAAGAPQVAWKLNGMVKIHSRP
ncbi:MAG: hypothetical protein NW201_11545 [Gemmatimonadales bacterium]|nr:hypothetical protein [Gemmatimonadales bacterium]